METPPFAAVYDDATAILAIAGDIDETGLSDFRSALEHATAHHSRSTTVDLSAVTLLTSSALATLATARHRSTRAAVELDVTAPRDSIAGRVLAITGIPFRTL